MSPFATASGICQPQGRIEEVHHRVLVNAAMARAV